MWYFEISCRASHLICFNRIIDTVSNITIMNLFSNIFFIIFFFQAKVIPCEKSTGVFCIEVETDAVSPFVWLEVRGIKGTFSKNGYLQIDPVETVDFQAADVSNQLKSFNIFGN